VIGGRSPSTLASQSPERGRSRGGDLEASEQAGRHGGYQLGRQVGTPPLGNLLLSGSRGRGVDPDMRNFFGSTDIGDTGTGTNSRAVSFISHCSLFSFLQGLLEPYVVSLDETSQLLSSRCKSPFSKFEQEFVLFLCIFQLSACNKKMPFLQFSPVGIL
jgi:hypothetical protein